MPRAKRNTPFQPSHGLSYGLRPVSHDEQTNVVVSVACRFCEKFGREEKVGAKRRATRHIKHFKQPFRTENYSQHHLGQHPTRWTEYQALSADRKAQYLASDFFPPDYHPIDNLVNISSPPSQHPVSSPPVQNDPPLPSTSPPQLSIASTQSPRSPLKFMIDRNIVEDIIANILFDPATEPISKDRVISTAFTTMDGPMPDYLVSINNTDLFHLIVQYVACGATPNLTSSFVAESTKSISSPSPSASSPNECSAPKISAYIRCVCAYNFQALADIMRVTWTFSLSFQRVSHSPSFYVDVHIRFGLSDGIYTFHILALPPPDRYNCHTSAASLIDILNILSHNWRDKLLGIVTDDSDLFDAYSNIDKNNINVIIDRLQHEATSPILRTWSAANQLDLVIKSVYNSLQDLHFVDTLTKLVAYLRRQEALIAETNSTCPKLASSHWRSIQNTLAWMKTNRIRILRYLKDKQSPYAPSMSWWIIAMAVSELNQAAARTYDRISGMSTLVSNQTEELAELVETLHRLSGCKGPVTDDELNLLSSFDLVVYQKYTVQTSSIREFLSGLSSFVQASLTDLAPKTADNVISKVGRIFLSTIVPLSNIILERKDNTAFATQLSPVLPRELIQLSRATFNADVRGHRARLCRTMSPTEIESIEQQFGDFLEAYHREETWKQSFKVTRTQGTFASEWGYLRSRFENLYLYCSGIATVFPQSFPKDSHFSMLPWHTDVFRECTTKDFWLEGSLQCRQYKNLMTLVGKVRS